MALSPTCSPPSSTRPSRGRLRLRPGRHARGRQGACERRDVPAQLALEAGMACGFGACFGCVVPRRGGGYLRVASTAPLSTPPQLEHVDAHAGGRAALSVEFCGLPLAHPVINGSGTFDAIAARASSASGCASASRSPHTSQRRSRSRPAPATRRRACGDARGADQLDRTAQQGPRRLPRRGPAAARRAGHRCRSGGSERAVPLITNVMGASAEELARLLRGLRRAR